MPVNAPRPGRQHLPDPRCVRQPCLPQPDSPPQTASPALLAVTHLKPVWQLGALPKRPCPRSRATIS